MPNKTLSVREDDLPLWERAERTAKANRQSLSGLVATALAHYLGDTDTLAVELLEEGRPRTVQFAGRWVVEPNKPALGSFEPVANDDPRFGCQGALEEWRVSIAETARGRVAIYLRHHDSLELPELRDFDTFDQAYLELGADPRIPREAWEQARRGLTGSGGGTVQWRDI